MKNIFAALASAAVACAAVAMPAAAEARATQPAINVSYADLNLNSEAGARIFVARVERASERVCGGEPDFRNLRAQRAYRACAREAAEVAMAALDHPMVADIYVHARNRA